MKHAGNIQLDAQLDGQIARELDSQLARDFDSQLARDFDRQLDPVSVNTVLLSLAALSMAVTAYLLG